MSADGSDLEDLDRDIACKLPSADFTSEGSSSDEVSVEFWCYLIRIWCRVYYRKSMFSADLLTSSH